METTTRICYKIVRKQEDRWISCSTEARRWVRTYSTKRWTKAVPGSGGLFVFGTLAAAKAFLWSNTGYYVWECECRDPQPRRRFASSRQEARDPRILQRFWEEYWKPHTLRGNRKVPSGTLFFGQVKLVGETPVYVQA